MPNITQTIFYPLAHDVLQIRVTAHVNFRPLVQKSSQLLRIGFGWPLSGEPLEYQPLGTGIHNLLFTLIA